MSDLERSPELEAQEVRNSVIKIRDREKTVSKKHGFGKYLTYWDADEARVLLYDSKMTMTTEFGQNIILTGIKNHHDPRLLVFDVDHIVALQFCPKEHLRAIFQVQEVFAPDGGLRIGDFAGEGLEQVKNYCEKMDKVIREEAFKLRGQGVKKIFEKMYIEMGGESIPQEDRVGRRFKFLNEISSLYNADKTKWKPFLLKLGLLDKG